MTNIRYVLGVIGHCIYWHETKAHRAVARVRLQLSWHVVGTGKTEGQARDIG